MPSYDSKTNGTRKLIIDSKIANFARNLQTSLRSKGQRSRSQDHSMLREEMCYNVLKEGRTNRSRAISDQHMHIYNVI